MSIDLESIYFPVSLLSSMSSSICSLWRFVNCVSWSMYRVFTSVLSASNFLFCVSYCLHDACCFEYSIFITLHSSMIFLYSECNWIYAHCRFCFDESSVFSCWKCEVSFSRSEFNWLLITFCAESLDFKSLFSSSMSLHFSSRVSFVFCSSVAWTFKSLCSSSIFEYVLYCAPVWSVSCCSAEFCIFNSWNSDRMFACAFSSSLYDFSWNVCSKHVVFIFVRFSLGCLHFMLRFFWAGHCWFSWRKTNFQVSTWSFQFSENAYRNCHECPINGCILIESYLSGFICRLRACMSKREWMIT